MFTDSRLHVSVRPCLEYKIPEMCMIVRDIIVGDRDKRDLVVICEQCLLDVKSVDIRYVDIDDQLAQELRQMCTLVCSQVDEYLRHLSASWKAHIDSIYSTVKSKTSELQSEANNACHVSNYYSKKVSSDIVLKEYRKELRRLKNDLNSMLSEMRMRPTPSIQRPDELVQSTQTLRDMFANLYGRMSTKDIITLKQDFENQMSNIQFRIATRFIEQLLSYIN